MLKIIEKDLKSKIIILDKLDKKNKFKRVFFLVAKKKVIRGNHAHKKCTQGFFSLSGSFYIEYTSINDKKKKILIEEGKQVTVIKPLSWVKVYLNANNICGVLCDRYYEESDYIRDYDQFKNYKKKLK